VPPNQNREIAIWQPLAARDGCAYALANAGHDTRALQAWLGHKNIQHTVRYTELAPDRFKDFWH
jgi:site-specific recombinase XerD